MRISDDRYSRDRLRLDIALRFIQHQARTQTIRSWTGLTDDRIRKLYRSYLSQSGRVSLTRPRGRSPGQVSFFLRSPRLRQEAALLASFAMLIGALGERRTPRTPQGVPQALLLCQAYEAYRTLLPNARVSFEHMVFLVESLARAEEVRVSPCSVCGAITVSERVMLASIRCMHCSEAPEVAPRPAGERDHSRRAAAAP